MSLTERAINDFQQITGSADDFGVSITLIAPNDQQVTLYGFHTKHHLGVEAEGQQVNSKKASIAFSDRNLTKANGHYPLRNGNGEVDLKNHRVNVADSTGATRTYMVREFFPDEKISAIVVILEDYQA